MAYRFAVRAIRVDFHRTLIAQFSRVFLGGFAAWNTVLDTVFGNALFNTVFCDTGFKHSALGFCRKTALSISGVAQLFVALGLTVFVSFLQAFSTVIPPESKGLQN